MGRAGSTYSDFSVMRSLRQVNYLVRRDRSDDARRLHNRVKVDAERLRCALGVDALEGLDILEIGPGQAMERAYWYGRHNDVTAVDLDEIVDGFNVGGYVRMLRTNGAARVVKTLGRRVLVGGRQQKAWADEIESERLSPPLRIRGDFCEPDLAASLPKHGAYDAVVSWSVFEHLPDARAAIGNVVDVLAPGGAALISIHNYTAIDGHHDIRSFTGGKDSLPLWGHLRPDHAHEINPSAYLNELRIRDWQALVDELMPGAEVHLDKFEHPEVWGPKLVGELREELSDYTEEELLTVNMVIVWRKPEGSPSVAS